MNKVTEIVTAWAVSFNPNEEQQKLAKSRYEVCLSCEQKTKTFGIEICGKCGCPLSKKIFTQKRNDTCPLNKWKDVEEDFRKENKEKNKYKLI